jgi:hypothetical protein
MLRPLLGGSFRADARAFALRGAGLRGAGLRTAPLRLGLAGRFVVTECLFMAKL